MSPAATDTSTAAAVTKDCDDRKPRTTATPTPAGRKAFERHVRRLEAMLADGRSAARG